MIVILSITHYFMSSYFAIQCQTLVHFEMFNCPIVAFLQHIINQSWPNIAALWIEHLNLVETPPYTDDAYLYLSPDSGAVIAVSSTP